MVLEQIKNPINEALTSAGLNIDASTILMALGVLVLAYIANKISNRGIDRAVESRSGSKHASATGKKLSSYVIYSLGLVGLLGVFGVPLTALGTAVGLIGLGISFALKDIIANFISGIFIMINRPFKIGDQIKVEGEEGTVKDIQIRATEVKTYDGRKVIVPNSKLYSGTVINNTAYDERRFEVVVGIGYEEDIDNAKKLAEEALRESEGVETDPEPQVLVNELGGSSVDLKLRGWTKPSKANMVSSASEVTQLVKQKYDAEGIEIPYPIRTVYMED